MRVIEVRTKVAPFSSASWLDEHRVSTPMSRFPRFAPRRSSWRGPGADTVSLWVRTDDDAVFGLGQTRGGTVVEELVHSHLTPLLVGQEPREVVVRTEELRHAVAPYASGGVGSMAVSACELALWDLTARAADVPLNEILGGHAQPLPYYLTCDAPDRLASAPIAGARAVKVAMPYGPVDGEEGLGKNLALLEAMRGAVPDQMGLAVDCFMSWDTAYTREFVQRAVPCGLRWVEEPLPPHQVENYARLRTQVAPVQLAAGEHLFGLDAALRYLESDAVDILQVDVTWCGGLRVAGALAAVAAERGVLFAPHAGGLQPWTVHLLSACAPPVMAEVLLGTPVRPALPPQAGKGPGIGLGPSDLGFER